MSTGKVGTEDELSSAIVISQADSFFYRSAFDPELDVFPPHPRQDYDAIFVEPPVYRDNALGRMCGPITAKIFGIVFNYTQAAVYYGLVWLLGFFVTFMWALMFSLMNYVVVWMWQPMNKIVFIFIRASASMVRATVRSMLDPVFESWGQCFSFIRVKLGVKNGKDLPSIQQL